MWVYVHPIFHLGTVEMTMGPWIHWAQCKPDMGHTTLIYYLEPVCP